MAHEELKDFNAMLHNRKNMPKIVEIQDEAGIKKWGGRTMVIAPPTDYDKYMKTVPEGRVITTQELRRKVAADYRVEVCCPLTCGIFTQIAAWASHQRSEDKTPYWRTLKAGGELNPKYPGGCEEQKRKLEAEGHHIIAKGRTTKKYYVENYQDLSFPLS